MESSYAIPTGSTKNQLDTKRGESGTINRNLTSPPAPVAGTPSTIAATTLTTPQAPYEIPKQTGTTSADNLAVANTSISSNIKADATVEAPVENKAKAALADDFTKLKSQIFGTDAEVDQVRQEEDIYNKKKAATAADVAMDKLDREYQAKVAEIKKNPEGKFAGAIEAQLADEYDRYHNNRANLALEYKVAAGAYNDAAQIVNDKIASLDKRNTNALNLYQLAINAVNNDMTESEKLQAQAKYQEQSQQKAAVLDAYKTVLKNAADNGAPASVLAAIDEASRAPGATGASIISAAGSYAKDPQVRLAEQKARQELDAGNISISNPAASPYAGALQIILASGKFTKDQKASIIAGINSGEDPFTVIKNNAKGILGQTGETTLTKYETAQSAMTDIQNALKAYYAKGGKTDIFSGNYEKVINKLGSVSDPGLVDIATQIQASLQVYRNAVSGTAYSEQEGKDIAAIFPGINKTEGLNQAIINGRMKAFDSTIDATYRTALGSTYDSLKKANQQGVKGTLSSAEFVEKTLNGLGKSYEQAVAETQPGMKRVIDNKTGKLGNIEPYLFDPKLYTPI